MAPRPRTQHGGGALRLTRKPAGAPFSISSGRKQLLRQRCEALGFTPLPIETIARGKVGPAFEPQELSWVDVGLTKIRARRGCETGPPSIFKAAPQCGKPLTVSTNVYFTER